MSDRGWQIFLTLEAVALGACICIGVLYLLAPLVLEILRRWPK